jgi:monoamine oxidase
MGGAQQLAFRMASALALNSYPTYYSRVVAVRAVAFNDMQVDIKDQNGNISTGTYAGVFNSTTLGCLRQVDTSLAGLNYPTKQAIRSLGYGPSAKVGIKFRRAWWIHDLGKYNIKAGGLGHSDLTIRTCVYPSYNYLDDQNSPAVLLCSYTWQQDAERIGAFMSSAPASDHKRQLDDEAYLKELLIRDLVRLHHNDEMSDDQLYKLISTYYLDHYAHDWTHDPNTVGAFAFFRPQQFSEMWPGLIQPSGNFVIIGEAASPHHAWVVGALESAIHGVDAWLGANLDIPGAAQAKKILETPVEGNPFVGLPPYMEPNMADWHSYLALLARDELMRKRKEEGRTHATKH